jgi:hypothetical protein
VWFDSSAAASLLGLDRSLEAFDANDPGGRALLLGRSALLATAWWVATQSKSPSGDRWFAALGFCFLGSLAARGLGIPFALLAVAGSVREPRALFASLLLVACTAVAVVAWPRQPPGSDDLTSGDANPIAETVRWAARDNPFRARFWAAQWSAREASPGSGHLTLARADWELGHAEEARRGAAKVVDEADNDKLKGQAAALLREWELVPR